MKNILLIVDKCEENAKRKKIPEDLLTHFRTKRGDINYQIARSELPVGDVWICETDLPVAIPPQNEFLFDDALQMPKEHVSKKDEKRVIESTGCSKQGLFLSCRNSKQTLTRRSEAAVEDFQNFFQAPGNPPTILPSHHLSKKEWQSPLRPL